MKYKEINLSPQRKEIYDFYSKYEYPIFNICFDWEFPNYFKYCKETNLSPMQFFLYHLSRATLEIENFSYREFEGRVIQIESLITSYTCMRDSGVFNIVNTPYKEQFDEFYKSSLNNLTYAKSSEKFLYGDSSRVDYIVSSCLPWFKMTSMENPSFSLKNNTIPKISWGKKTEANDKIIGNISIQIHHGLVDGIHVNQLFERINLNMNEHINNS